MRDARALPFAAGVALVVASLLVRSDFVAILLVWVAVNVLLTASFRFVTLIGELNFAIAGFVGIGAYAAGSATTMLDAPFVLALAAGAAAAGAVSLGFGWVTLRAKGPYFLLISFAFTEVLRLVYTQTSAIGGNSGLVGIFPPAWLTGYYPATVLALVVAGLWVLHRLEHSDFGRILIAIRNNDLLVQTVGIDVHRTKVVCLAIASVFAGLGGALLAHANNVISPGDFGFLLAVFALAYLKVGGEGHFAGSIVGATLLTLLAQYALGFGAYEHIFYGSAIVLVVLLMPEGIVGRWVVWRARRTAAARGQAAKG
jgi:branched-chain amino acid transport system permease protein